MSDSPRPGAPRRGVAGLVCLVLALALGGAALALPAPFVREDPGPVVDVLGSSGGTRMIRISGARTYPTSGSLDLTTVSARGGPGDAVGLAPVVVGWLRRTSAVLPRGAVYAPRTTERQARTADAADMTTSQEDATLAALHELGITVPATIRVVAAQPGTGAVGRLRRGDVVTAVDGVPVDGLDALRAALVGRGGATVAVTLARAGAPVVVDVPTSTVDGKVVLGVAVDPAYRFPIDVKITVDRIGGPSAGTVFALGIVDRLTPGSLTGGHRVAGTGTISPDGAVGAIGGIRQKMAGAAAAGATTFLAPRADCDEVVGHVPAGLRVVAVSTLHQAREAVEAVAAGRAGRLAGCGS